MLSLALEALEAGSSLRLSTKITIVRDCLPTLVVNKSPSLSQHPANLLKVDSHCLPVVLASYFAFIVLLKLGTCIHDVTQHKMYHNILREFILRLFLVKNPKHLPSVVGSMFNSAVCEVLRKRLFQATSHCSPNLKSHEIVWVHDHLLLWITLIVIIEHTYNHWFEVTLYHQYILLCDVRLLLTIRV